MVHHHLWLHSRSSGALKWSLRAPGTCVVLRQTCRQSMPTHTLKCENLNSHKKPHKPFTDWRTYGWRLAWSRGMSHRAVFASVYFTCLASAIRRAVGTLCRSWMFSWFLECLFDLKVPLATCPCQFGIATFHLQSVCLVCSESRCGLICVSLTNADRLSWHCLLPTCHLVLHDICLLSFFFKKFFIAYFKNVLWVIADL